jgi:biotin transport system substrate-specific component
MLMLRMHTIPAAATCGELFRPQATSLSVIYSIMLVLAGSWLMAASAWVEVRLPISVVPITGQTFGVLFVAALLGSRLGTAAVIAYLSQGAAGLPVFAGGAAGLAWLLGPTGGYLIGFLPAAFIVGLLAERGWDRRPLSIAVAMVLGNAAIYLVGLPWLAMFVGPGQAVAQGLLPFIPGAIVKIALATAMLPLGWRVLSLMRVDASLR